MGAMTEWWLDFQDTFYRCCIEDDRWKYLVRGLGNTLLITFFALILGVLRAARGELDFGTLAAVLQLLFQLRAPVLNLSGLAPRLAVLTASSRRLEELEDLPEEETAPCPPARSCGRWSLSTWTFSIPATAGPC